jgi:hypothetical protein
MCITAPHTGRGVESMPSTNELRMDGILQLTMSAIATKTAQSSMRYARLRYRRRGYRVVSLGVRPRADDVRHL